MNMTSKDIFDYGVKQVTNAMNDLEEYLAMIHASEEEIEVAGVALLGLAHKIKELM
ncbi:MAG: hypothetical protein IJZ72_02905 [Oscillospiraceae bacterium]|nr:hypothetical protein [Oscillospiraceae bacterium]